MRFQQNKSKLFNAQIAATTIECIIQDPQDTEKPKPLTRNTDTLKHDLLNQF